MNYYMSLFKQDNISYIIFDFHIYILIVYYSMIIYYLLYTISNKQVRNKK